MRPGIQAILDALAFDDRPRALDGLTADDFAFADRALLTPLLSRFKLAPAARKHVDGAVERNSIRSQHIAAAYREIAGGFEHVVLKGFTHIPDLIEDSRLRAQYDLDLYVPPAQSEAAREALAGLGYEPIGRMEHLAMDHLPTMVRKTGWEWRGDYFDPDLPPAIEVHFRFWDAATEKLLADGVEEFWERREENRLALVDRLGYAALHLARHLLRGNVRPLHVWEIAHFLHTHHDPAFWREWQRLHSPGLRRIEAVAFLLAESWFAPSISEQAAQEMRALPAAAHRWFELYRWSPIEALFKPNKDELWLHLSLLDSAFDRMQVARRRLIPASLPGPVDAIHIPDQQMTLARRAQRQLRNSSYAVSRAAHHARLLAPTLWQGWLWCIRLRRIRSRR